MKSCTGKTGLAVLMLMLAGCTSSNVTNTARTAKEQLLISNSVDQALDKVDFQPFGGHAVYLDDQYLESVDKSYIVGSLRERLFLAGAAVVPGMEEAEIVLEVRSGGVGTDSNDTFLGLPEVAVPGPMPVATPEVRVLSRSKQSAIAKLGLVAYDARTKQILGRGGTTLAESDDDKWFLLGAGPYRNGSLKKDLKAAATKDQRIEPLSPGDPSEETIGRRDDAQEPAVPLKMTGGSGGLESTPGRRPRVFAPREPD